MHQIHNEVRTYYHIWDPDIRFFSRCDRTIPVFESVGVMMKTKPKRKGTTGALIAKRWMENYFNSLHELLVISCTCYIVYL